MEGSRKESSKIEACMAEQVKLTELISLLRQCKEQQVIETEKLQEYDYSSNHYVDSSAQEIRRRYPRSLTKRATTTR